MSRFVDLSTEELAKFHRSGQEAAQSFQETLGRLADLASRFDPFELLSRMAMTTISSQANFGSPEYNPLLHVYHLEFLQAIALSAPSGGAYQDGPLPEMTDEIIRLVNENAEAFRERELQTLTPDGRTNAFNNLIDQVQVTTQTVRGARHAFQTRQYLKAVADQLDVHFERAVGCTLSSFVNYVESIAGLLDKRLEAFRATQRRWMSASNFEKTLKLFDEANPHLSAQLDMDHASAMKHDLQQLKHALLTLLEGQYAPMFCMPKPEDAALRELVESRCLQFGDVDNAAIANLHLNNPVWRKPFIALDAETIFWPNPQSLFAFLVEIVDDLSHEHLELKGRVEKAKAVWLEQKLRTVLEAAFPSARILTGVHWTDRYGAARETDAVILIDKVVGIFEAKSGRVSSPARRGAQDRLRREIKRLIVQPSEQSDALRSAIREGPVEVQCDQGSFVINSSEAREFVRVNILFDTIGTLSAHWPQLKEHDLVDRATPLAPTMSIFELETILDSLPSETRRLHYLKRREEIERHGSYLADELDLLALYFDTSFVIGRLEFSDTGFGIYGLSEKIASAYDHIGRSPDFNLALKQSRLWATLLSNLEELKPNGWTRFAFRLCSISYKAQMSAGRELEKAFRKARKMRSEGTVHFGFSEGGESHRNVIAFAVGKSLSDFSIISHCNDAAAHAMSQADADSCLVIYHDAEAKAGRYRYIASVNRHRAGTSARLALGPPLS